MERSGSAINRPLVFAEELQVLLLDRQRGGLVRTDNRNVRYAFAGAVLMDLAKEYRIDTDLERLTLTDSTPLGDEILDPLLVAMSGESDGAKTVYWIERFSAPEIANQIQRRAVDRLIQRGIFDADPGGTIFLNNQVSLTRRYPGIPPPEGQDVVLRVMNVIFSEDIPSPDETMLIALVDACGIFGHILSKTELAERRDRIALVRNLDLIGLSVRNAILSVREPDTEDQTLRQTFLEPTTSASPLPPMLPGALPFIGHSLSMRPVPTQRLADAYHSLGPVFRGLDMARELTNLAGPEANLFCQKHGRTLFRTHDAYTPMFQAMDAQRIILAMDGEEHFRLRRAISSGFSRNQYLNKLPAIQDIILGELPENGNLVTTDVFGQLTAKSIGLACTGFVLSDGQVKDVDFFMRRLVAATVLHVLPKFMMRTTRMKQAKAGFFNVSTDMLRTRLDSQSKDNQGDVIDAMLELYQSDPQFMPEHEFRVSCLTPIFAGMHTTASTGSFALYLLLKHPDVLERVQAEADELFANGGPTPEKMKALDVTRRTILETLRMHNPFTPLSRSAVNSFDFGGYTISAGTRLFLPTAVPHHCPEFFPEPDRFDIDRYLPERAEHKQSGVYMPFGFGTHRCLGSAIADNHLMFSLATILHHRKVRMDPPDYKMKIIFDGVPAPTKRFRISLSPRH